MSKSLKIGTFIGGPTPYIVLSDSRSNENFRPIHLLDQIKFYLLDCSCGKPVDYQDDHQILQLIQSCQPKQQNHIGSRRKVQQQLGN